MDAARTNTFQDARAFERDLNPRQREVLALIAAGKTNAEIAEALDLSFYGAKWNVSEILSKLGLSSREEAADYWRWRQSAKTRVSEMVRALVPVGLPGKVAMIGTPTALVVLAVVVLSLFGRESSPSVTRSTPFEMEVTSTSTMPDGSVQTTHNRWAWQDPSHYRTDVQTAAQDGTIQTLTQIADGRSLWTIYPGGTVADERPVDEPPDFVPDTAFYLIGPSPAPTVESLLTYLDERYAGVVEVPQSARIVGEEEFQGRETTVIEFAPVTTATEASGDGPTTPFLVGTGRIWVDESSMFILRNESTFEASEVRSILLFPDTLVSEVTRLDFNPAFAPGTFAYEAPTDEANSSGSQNTPQSTP